MTDEKIEWGGIRTTRTEIRRRMKALIESNNPSDKAIVQGFRILLEKGDEKLNGNEKSLVNRAFDFSVQSQGPF